MRIRRAQESNLSLYKALTSPLELQSEGNFAIMHKLQISVKSTNMFLV